MRLYPCCMPIFGFSCLAACLVASSVSAEAQAPPESSQKLPQPVDSKLPRAQPPDASDDDPITLRTIVPNIWKDQGRIYWAYPKALAHGHQLLPTIAFVAATGALIAADQYESPYFRRTTTFHGFNAGLSGTNTSLLIAGVPVATYLVGLIKKDTYAQRTALWTAEAVADSEVTAEVLKLVTRRARPESIRPNGNFGDTWTDSPTVNGGSFPSAHTIAAFSVATVMSRRYGRDHKWVPFVAYGLAATVGFSRVTLSAHNVSDVFVGAGLGYAISRFLVLGRHH